MGEKKEKQASKKSGFEVLFPEIRVEGFDVKPWSFKRAKTITPALAKIIKRVGRFYEQAKKELGAELGSRSILDVYPLWDTIAMLIPEFDDEAPEIVSKTFDIPVEEIEEMEWGKVDVLFVAILRENLEYIASFFVRRGGESLTTLLKMSSSSSREATG